MGSSVKNHPNSPSPSIVQHFKTLSIIAHMSACDQEEQRPVVEVVDVVHEVSDEGGSGVRDRRAARGLEVAELEAEPDEAEDEAEHEPPEGALLIGPLPEHAEQEHSGHLRGQDVGDGLV